MGFQGSVKHIMLYQSSISDAGANVFYGGQSQLNNHNLAITYNGARLLKSEDNGVGLKTNESCLIEDHAQPFSFWRIVRDCTDKEKADRAGTACYKYYAGHLNALDPRTKYELRSSVDEYVLEKALETERKFNSKGIGEPLRIGRSFQTHLNIKVWGAGGGLAPEWRAKNPKRPDAMSLGCAEQELIHGYAVCKTGWQTDKCEDKGGVEGDESYVVGDHKCVLPGLNSCVACRALWHLPGTDWGSYKVRVCVRPGFRFRRRLFRCREIVCLPVLVSPFCGAFSRPLPPWLAVPLLQEQQTGGADRSVATRQRLHRRERVQRAGEPVRRSRVRQH